jgi:hypothetical protein
MTSSFKIDTPVTFVADNSPVDFSATSGVVGDNTIKNFVASTAGDTLYGSGGVNNLIERLPIGTSNQVLTVNLGLPSWQNTQFVSSPFQFKAFDTSGLVVALLSTVNLNYNNVETNVGFTYNSGTGLITVLNAGEYIVSVQTTTTAGVVFSPAIYKNGVLEAINPNLVNSGVPLSRSITCAANDTLQVKLTAGLVAATLVTTGKAYNYITITSV